MYRYALACSFSRTSIRRADVVKKVMDDEVSLITNFVEGRGAFMDRD